MGAHNAAFWEGLYKTQDVETLPWFMSGLDHDFARVLKKFGSKKGPVLDLGTGPGTQAMALAKRGFEVTATDISKTAVLKAERRAKEAGLKIDFRQDDILRTKLDRTFDRIFDRGCFHAILPRKRARYIRNVHALLREGGFLFLKCFSYKETYDEGPYRFRPEELKKLFGKLFKVRSIRGSFFKGVRRPHPRALFCVIMKEKKKGSR